ncbi:MAG: glycoside hydrolase family 15 protein [Rhodocyclaceae bacterium]|nr:glycoside hydrolase family 15 protein [Rhodocyclaceae bacterium]MBK6555213.1 glycoside hydrolase family 15 protein [Rhodocyclaceae bacterium]MBK9309504.1 glycoside hydrolase family 15 protein [Rhodocyclaceae bacterium]MBK9955404.1 glycoside hydrolase family 15 protein [Rhodocyclaceae bacterium]
MAASPGGSLELALIGNCAVGALIDDVGRVVWGCFPRFDGDPVFCSLLRTDDELGVFAVDIADFDRAEQHYLENTAILVTRLFDRNGGGVEITDFAPRFRLHGRMFRPMMLVRQLRRIGGSPRLTLGLRPACGHGAARPEVTWGSHHVRYVTPDLTLRLTTDASITALLQETPFFLEDRLTLLLGPDETVHESVAEIGRRFEEETAGYWRDWVRALNIPYEWQEAVIRAAITLKLNAHDDTGAIVAAMTTSLPEAADSGRNWDYRYCWLRDGYFVVNALNRLGTTHTMERYLGYIVNIAADAAGRPLQPVYRIDGRADLEERIEPALPGYRGMGPVRVGNQAYRQVQHDSYGSAVLAATHVFFDQRLTRRGDEALFRRLEPLGELAVAHHDQPDAGLWELRGSARVHTYSAVMCWAACDRLARIADHLGLTERAAYWSGHARIIHAVVCRRAWSERRGAFVASFDGDTMDASLLLLAELGFLAADDPRFAATVEAIATELKRGDFIFRYVEQDDFGEPENAFLVCTFWYINALAAIGRKDEARALFEKMLAARNRHGLLAEHIDTRTGELWGNFVQTYSMVGLINSAIRLSVRWDQAF